MEPESSNLITHFYTRNKGAKKSGHVSPAGCQHTNPEYQITSRVCFKKRGRVWKWRGCKKKQTKCNVYFLGNQFK